MLVAGDWHTAYLLLYGPRRLRKFEAAAAAAEAVAADEEMDATAAAEADAAEAGEEEAEAEPRAGWRPRGGEARGR